MGCVESERGLYRVGADKPHDVVVDSFNLHEHLVDIMRRMPPAVGFPFFGPFFYSSSSALKLLSLSLPKDAAVFLLQLKF
jgi:hypothetical protein